LLAKHSSQKRRRRNRRAAPAGSATTTATTTADPANSSSGLLHTFRTLRKERTLLRGPAPPPPGTKKAYDRPKLALCFLIVEDIPHEEVWREWIKQSVGSKYGVRVYIHAKFPERLASPWMKAHLIRDARGDVINFKPNWGQIEVTRALLKLFEVALRDDDVERMAYVSESCIPVTTFAAAARALWDDNPHGKSWLAAYQTPVDGYDSMMMNAVDTKAIPKECVYKCDTWVMLTRRHAHAVLVDLPKHAGGPLWPYFSRVKVADEICLPTLLAIVGAIVSPDGAAEGDQVERRKVTYVDWTKGGPHPRAFAAFTADVAGQARENRAIFARKFSATSCRVDAWCRLCDDPEVAVWGGEGSAPPAPTSTVEEFRKAQSQPAQVDVLPPFPKGKKRENLAIVCAGDNSLHHDMRWFCDHRSFDLCVVYFGSDAAVEKRYEAESTHFIKRQGPKWQLIRHALKQSFWRQYEYIWMPDDDLSIDVPAINEFFALAKAHRLNLCQPALVDINVEHRILVQQPGSLLRFTNFVEIMAPCLHREALKHVFRTLDEDRVKSGWGLDLVWPHLLNYNRVAVVDKTPMIHTRPVTAFNPNAFFYRKYNIDPLYEGQETLKKYNVRPFKPRTLGRIK
jgi:hypothetical protein